MPTVLITGANRGIGLEFARQYAAAGWTVHATARNPDQAQDLAAVAGAVEIHRLDIGAPDQISDLAAALSGARIDLLLNNAGVSGAEHAALGEIDYQAWLDVLRINALAPLQVAEAFTPHVARSAAKLMVFLTSRAGSIANNLAGSRYPYRSSKAALNAIVRSLAIDLLPQRITCIAVHPGWARTDMGGEAAPLDPAESVARMRELFARIEPHDSGHFLNYDGADLAW